MSKIDKLYKKLKAQGGRVTISEDDASGVSSFARQFQMTELSLVNASVSRPYQRLVRYLLEKASGKGKTQQKGNIKVTASGRKLTSSESRQWKRVVMARKAVALGYNDALLRDDEVYPLLPLLEGRIMPKAAAYGTLRSYGRKKMSETSANFFRTLQDVVVVRGMAGNNQKIKATFWSEANGIHAKISGMLTQTAAQLLLYRVLHPELAALHFGIPLLVFSTHGVKAGKATMPLFSGTRLYCPFEFAANLQRAVTFDTPQILIGRVLGVTPEGPVFSLQSTPFNLDFANLSIGGCTLFVNGSWNADVGMKEYSAWISGICETGNWAYRLPLNTNLPNDNGAACWNTVGPAEYFDPESGEIPQSLQPREGEFNEPARLDELESLTGNWGGWYQQPAQLAHLLSAAQPMRLVHVETGINIPNAQSSDVLITVRSEAMKISQFDAGWFGPVIFRWSIIQPWDAAQRSTLVDIAAHFHLGGMTFIGSIRVPDGMFQGYAIGASVQVIDSVMRSSNPNLHTAWELGANALDIAINVFTREVRMTALLEQYDDEEEAEEDDSDEEDL